MVRSLPWSFRLLLLRNAIREALGIEPPFTEQKTVLYDGVRDYPTADAFYANLSRLKAMSLEILFASVAREAQFFDEALFAVILKRKPDLAPVIAANPRLPNEGAAWLVAWCCREIRVGTASARRMGKRAQGQSVFAERVERRGARTLSRLVRGGRATLTPPVVEALQAFFESPLPQRWSEAHDLPMERKETPAALLDCLAPAPECDAAGAAHALPLFDHPNGGARYWGAFRAVHNRMVQHPESTNHDRQVLLPHLAQYAPSAHFPAYWRELWQVWPERAMELLVGRSLEDIDALGLTIEEVAPILQSDNAVARMGAVMAMSTVGTANRCLAEIAAGEGRATTCREGGSTVESATSPAIGEAVRAVKHRGARSRS